MSSEITALVIGLNESLRLEDALKSVRFCKKVIYVDLNSTDNSVEIAKRNADIIYFSHELSIPELFKGNENIYIQYWILDQLETDWVLFLDPDERIDIKLQQEIASLHPKVGLDVGMIVVPWIFYFKNKKLNGTFWGGIKSKVILYNKYRISKGLGIHIQHEVLPGFKREEIQFTGENILHHYWMSSYSYLLNKHVRYLKLEGKTLYEAGKRVKLSRFPKIFLISIHESYIYFKGYKDGLIGIGLTIFYCWYMVSRNIELYKYQQKMKKV